MYKFKVDVFKKELEQLRSEFAAYEKDMEILGIEQSTDDKYSWFWATEIHLKLTIDYLERLNDEGN